MFVEKKYPSAMALVPPTMSSFSMTATLAPSFMAATAAVRAAMPLPTTSTSTSAASSTGSTVTGSWNESASPPACSTQSPTADRSAMLVMVAPLTTSTARDCASRMRCGSRSRAVSPMRGDSPSLVTTMASMEEAPRVTSTSMSLIMPWAEAAYVPGVRAGCGSPARALVIEPADRVAPAVIAAMNVRRETEVIAARSFLLVGGAPGRSPLGVRAPPCRFYRFAAMCSALMRPVLSAVAMLQPPE